MTTDRSRASRSPTPRSATTTSSCTPSSRPAWRKAAARAARRPPPQLRRRRASATATARSRSARRSTGRSWARSPGAPARTSRTRSRPPGPPSRPGRAGRGRSGSRSCAGPPTLISERQMEFAALMAIEVGKNRLEALGDVEETADLHPLLLRHDRSATTASTTPWATWATRPSTPARSSSRTASGPSSARSTSRSRSPAGRPAARSWPATRSSTSRRSDAPLSGVMPDPGRPRRGLPDGVFNLVMGPGETVGAELQENPGVDGIIFTGSYEVGFELYKNFARRFPKPVIVEMGGKNPAIVTAPGRPGRGGRGHHALRVRLQRPEVLGQQPGLRRAARSTTSSSGGSSRRPRRSRSATRSTGANWLGPGHRPAGRRPVRAGGRRGPPRRRGLIGGERLTEDGLDAGFFVAPTVVGDLPVDHRLFRDELFVPFTAVAAVDSLDEALRLANDTRPTA